MSLALQYYVGHVGSGWRVKDNNRGNGKLFILLISKFNLFLLNTIVRSQWFQTLRALPIRIEIVLPRGGWQLPLISPLFWFL